LDIRAADCQRDLAAFLTGILPRSPLKWVIRAVLRDKTQSIRISKYLRPFAPDLFVLDLRGLSRKDVVENAPCFDSRSRVPFLSPGTLGAKSRVPTSIESIEAQVGE